MKTKSEQINKQVTVITKKLMSDHGFIDLAVIRNLFRPALSEKTAKDRILKIRDSEVDLYLFEHKILGYKLIKRVDKKQESENIGQFRVGGGNFKNELLGIAWNTPRF